MHPLLFLAAVPLLAAQMHTIRVSGELVSRAFPAPDFDITVEHTQQPGATPIDNVTVFAEPSHTLLVAVNGRMPAAQRASLLYHPAAEVKSGKPYYRRVADSHLDVVVTTAGVAHVVSHARINFARFGFSSMFDFRGGTPINENQCCYAGSLSCGCKDCGASNDFCCDAINCKASCSKNCPDLVAPKFPVGWLPIY
jgi:hypothetical protein